VVGWLVGWLVVRLVYSRGQSICPIIKDLADFPSRVKQACPLKVVQIGYTDTSVINYQSALSNITEQRRSHLHQRGSPQSRIT